MFDLRKKGTHNKQTCKKKTSVNVECRRTNPVIKGEYLFSTATIYAEINDSFDIAIDSEEDEVIDEEHFDVNL
jgi:hypothetical protein